MYDEVAAAALEPRAVGAVDFAWQPGLLAEFVGIDHGFTGLRRIALDEGSWVDHVPGWLSGADEVFEALRSTASWTALTVLMWERLVPEPRLTARWDCGAEPGVLASIRLALCTRYAREFDSVGVNLYRDGRDSVAWHRDRVHRRHAEPVVATVTLGAARRFLLRPLGGGHSLTFTPHAGDLIVMGGRCQQDWEHTVPKCADAGPRMRSRSGTQHECGANDQVRRPRAGRRGREIPGHDDRDSPRDSCGHAQLRHRRRHMPTTHFLTRGAAPCPPTTGPPG